MRFAPKSNAQSSSDFGDGAQPAPSLVPRGLEYLRNSSLFFLLNVLKTLPGPG